jgi:hypothetical protein
MTGAERGACEVISGTPYIGGDQLAAACGADAPAGADSHGQSDSGSSPWTSFSVVSPARAAQLQRDATSSVTGTSYEDGQRITGPFDLAGGKVTGTEQFRFDNREFQTRQQQTRQFQPTVMPPQADKEPAKPVSRVTGEGSSTKVTGDDWDRGEHVTGTEGVSARRRNPTRPGPMSAMAPKDNKRNEEIEWPMSRVTGSSGSTDKGSLITLSGGARG